MDKEEKKPVIEVIKDQLATMQETLDAQGAEIEELKKRPYAKKQLFGGKSERRPITDTVSGNTYVSMSAVGKALAKEADTAPDDHFAFYKLQNKFPDRFRDATDEESAKATAEEEILIAEALKKADEEEAAREEAEKSGKSSKGK